jgi:hypothetical protein
MDSYDSDGTRLFRVHGTSADADARAVQVPEKAASLCSDDVFVLETPAKTYIWIGKVIGTGFDFIQVLVIII